MNKQINEEITSENITPTTNAMHRRPVIWCDAAFRWFGGPLVHPCGFQRDSFSWADEPEIDQNSSMLRLDSPRKHCSSRVARSHRPQITCIIFKKKKRIKKNSKKREKSRPSQKFGKLVICQFKLYPFGWWEENNCTFFSFVNAGKAWTKIWKYGMLKITK